MKLNVDCLLWVKTRFPAEANVDPVGFVRTVVLDAQDRGQGKESQIATRTRYLNRLTPVSVMTKATEQGLFEAARATLVPYFELVDKTKEKEQEGSTNAEGVEASSGGDAAPAATDKGEEKKPFTYAIRPTIRNHSTLKRDFVIKEIAGLINDERHKVNLDNPDKVILIDIYQVCILPTPPLKPRLL